MPTDADLTDARRKRVEPIVKSILQQLVDENILLTDVTYIEQLVREHFDHIFKQVALVHLKETFDLVLDSLTYHVQRAKDIQWGKPEEERTVGDVEKVLVDAAKAKASVEKAQKKESESA